MTSAIRFSRSQSQSSQATQNSAVTGSGTVSSTSRRLREPSVKPPSAAAVPTDTSDGFQELPSSIPSAPSHPASQRTRTTTTATTTTESTRSSRGRSERHSQVKRPTPAEIAAAYPWSHYPPFPFPFPPPPATPAAAGTALPHQHQAAREKTPHGMHARVEPPSASRHGRQHAASYPYDEDDDNNVFPFAVPNIAWIPPPVLHGGTPPDMFHGSPYAEHPFLDHVRAQQRRHHRHSRASAHTNHRPFPVTSAASDWPTPDQLPTPSAFPMPPRMRMHDRNQHRSSAFDLFPPPPLPPWWFMQAMQQPAIPFAAVSQRTSSSGSSRSSGSSGSSSVHSESESSSSSRASSPSPRKQQQQQHQQQPSLFTPPSQEQQQRQQPSRATQRAKCAAPAGSVETPTPFPRGNNRTSHTTMSGASVIASGGSVESSRASDEPAATAAAARRAGPGKKAAAASSKSAASASVQSVRRRALPSRDSTEYAYEVRRPPHVASSAGQPPAPVTSSRAATMSDESSWAIGRVEEEKTEEEERRRMQDVLTTAESYLTRIEELYQRLRHRYEEVLLSPVKEGVQSPARSSQGSPPYHSFTPQFNRPQPTAAAAAAASTRAPSQTLSPTSHTTLAAMLGSNASPPVRISPSSTASTSASHSLRHELAMLESQWQRLEEMKQHGVGAGAGPAASSLTQARGAHFPLSATPAVEASPSVAARKHDIFNDQSVRELINDRKHLLASTA